MDSKSSVSGKQLEMHEKIASHTKTASDEKNKKQHQIEVKLIQLEDLYGCLLYTSPSPRDRTRSRMPSSA